MQTNVKIKLDSIWTHLKRPCFRSNINESLLVDFEIMHALCVV